MAREMTVERVPHSGAIVVSALVSDGRSTWFERRTFYGHTVREARSLFRDVHVASKGWRFA
jgi:hypothetical protein